MAELGSAYADAGVISDLDQLCDEEEDLDSSVSTASAGEEFQTEVVQSHSEEAAVSQPHPDGPTVPMKESPPSKAFVEKRSLSMTSATGRDATIVQETKGPARRLNLLDLPVDLLQDIIKEVTHTNDLTSLALTCSALHSLAVPQMYSRFDIVWPDAFPQSDHPGGVDALSYGLATLVMGEDIFREVPTTNAAQRCAHCECNRQQSQNRQASGRIRRGNYFAQYTRKFSVGNGPSDWVQEYSVTKETGKMLGTLVALAVARMVNLETFIWDMPTGVVRDVWIALSSLADRPGHECRLENVWIRWHDNSENAVRSLSGVPTASSLTLPETQNILAPPPASTSLFRRYGHVEYPSLSILPPLKSLSVLDIDEPSYLEEMAVLIRRSRDRLRELRIGISSKVYQASWLKPQGASHVEQTPSNLVSGWPRAGGVLGAILGWPSRHANESSFQQEDPVKGDIGDITVVMDAVTSVDSPIEVLSPQTLNTTSTQDVAEAQDIADAGNSPPISSHETQQVQVLGSKAPRESLRKPSKTIYSFTSGSDQELLKLEVLELERIPISAAVLLDTIDWTRVTTLTILRCEGHEKLWRSLRRRFSPSAAPHTSTRHGRSEEDRAQPEYALRIKHIHTDAVSPYLLLFIKDTLQPNTLETVFLHGSPLHDSAVHIEGIYRNVIRTHRSSLRKLLVDSTERSPAGVEIVNSRWQKWMFTREVITFITSGRMPKLKELSMTIDSKDWHYFLQRLPNIPQLRALHISHIVRPLHLDLKELAMQVLDIVTLRPEISISYLGMQSKCYEILEGKGNEYDLAETDDIHSEGFVPGAENWAGSDTNEEGSDEDDEGATMDSQSDLSSEDHRSLDDDDASDYDYGRPRVSFGLREILFYDDKIAIFKARHGVL
ncbi:hypothetical protein AN2106.2 [Aspergillus nidulans FGSC A4]|uniref:F-box domain-containing protein n=1 Tax=Emericella nidulans (strain FGSC A4 / ATCC 38163 / CBS 112.46 / NRRL 194 / M139) TaxID=227321 RepID=Q5BBH4_EMENI|nr:hypothetical protein [Aspergillus nidulans FGSC A4]EAA64938.1 hypothetical protein AN2106.2 [Aspergillus nidulans FGSC A4]CBF86189.1 TPA: conserved hypothetical protein [Aspergillus nidulans FGSC A4]|eukprot:XP_659710.1 hypothetical protein AN2106.2 [Aspergillus nidulans FGSC A4]